MMKGTRKGNLITGRYMITLTCITIAGCFLPLVLSSYMLRVMNIALISYMCVLSVYVLLGMCGQNSFAQAGFWGVGAYITANCLLKLNLGPIVSMIIAIAGTALFAFILGFAFFRLKQLAIQMTTRSHTNFHTSRQLCLRGTTVICSVSLSRTSILALMPWFFNASSRRPAAMAAPPMRSEVFISKTLITRQLFASREDFPRF